MHRRPTEGWRAGKNALLGLTLPAKEFGVSLQMPFFFLILSGVSCGTTESRNPAGASRGLLIGRGKTIFLCLQRRRSAGYSYPSVHLSVLHTTIQVIDWVNDALRYMGADGGTEEEVREWIVNGTRGS